MTHAELMAKLTELNIAPDWVKTDRRGFVIMFNSKDDYTAAYNAICSNFEVTGWTAPSATRGRYDGKLFRVPGQYTIKA